MLPLAHTYISTRATEMETPLLILGSILPDIATTSRQQIDRERIHNNPNEFEAFVKEKYPQFSDLSLGVRLHSQANGGVDFYSDDLTVGYAKLEGAKISKDVADLLGIEKGDISLLIAHNFIEMAVDLHICQNQRDIWELYSKTLDLVKVDFNQIANCLADYLKADPTEMLKELGVLVNVLGPDKMVSIAAAVDKGAVPMLESRFNKKLDRTKIVEITTKALDITAPTYKDFLDNTVVLVKQNILGI